MKAPSSQPSGAEQGSDDFKNRVRQCLTTVEDIISFVKSHKTIPPLIIEEKHVSYDQLKGVIPCKTDLGNDMFIKAGYFQLNSTGIPIHVLILENMQGQLFHVILQPDSMFR